MYDIKREMTQRGLSQVDWVVLCNSLPKIDSVKYPIFIINVFDYAKSRGMDVASGHIHAEVYFDNNKPQLKIMPTITGYRHVAHASGEFGGLDKPLYGPKIEIPLINGTVLSGPEWCEITAHRIHNGSKISVTSVEYLVENVVYGRNGLPTPIWRKRPSGQLNVRTEAQSLRKLFNKCDSHTPEEMETAHYIEASAEIDSHFAENKKTGSDEELGIVFADPKKPLLQRLVDGYAEAKNQDDVNKVSANAENSGSYLTAQEWESVISAYNEAQARIKAALTKAQA